MKNLNKTILLLTVFLTVLSISAQGPESKSRRERIKTLKVAYLTEQLSLNSKEAQVFWPIYNQYEEKRHEIRRSERNQIHKMMPLINDLTDKEASELLSKYKKIQQQKELTHSQFMTEISQVITDKKILLLLKAEEDFKKRLLQQYRNKRGQR